MTCGLTACHPVCIHDFLAPQDALAKCLLAAKMNGGIQETYCSWKGNVMDVTEVMRELEGYGNPATKKTYARHGAREPFFGVKVGDMQKILKKTKKDHALALTLFATGNADAMYLAGLMGDEKKVTREELEGWAEQAEWYMVSEYAVAGLAAESPLGWELGRRWIESEKPHVACTGWASLGGCLSVLPDDQLPMDEIEQLLDRIAQTIHGAPNRVRYTMNGFVIAAGAYVTALTAKAIALAKSIGKVSVNLGDTACKVPYVPEYLQKMIDGNRIGKKRKKVRC